MGDIRIMAKKLETTAHNRVYIGVIARNMGVSYIIRDDVGSIFPSSLLRTSKQDDLTVSG